MADATKMESQKDEALKILGTMLDYLGLEASCTGEYSGNRLIIKIASEEAGRIIGRRGATLESLQILLNRILFRGEEDTPVISLDIDGYSHGNVTGGREVRNSGERRERRPRRDGERSERGERMERGGEREDAVPEEQLRMLALDKAKEVKKWGQPVELAKMNAHDRRIIHINLQDDPEIETRSEGEGTMKKVIISLKKADN
ncbi:MAG: KH domain-containing protein [Victivallaceae bacterium]|nr:KH domain-containing protein [Victivallaceae bacterium]